MTCEDYKKIYESKKGTVQDALDMIHSGDVIWCSNNYNEPETLFGHLHEIADRVDNVIVYKSRIGRYPFMMTPGMNGHINCHNYFYGPSYREAHKLLNASFIPVDLPNYYRMVNRHKPCNIFTAQVSPMTEDGKLYVGMNQTIEYYAIKDAVEQHKKIIVEVNKNMPRCLGGMENCIHISQVTGIVEGENPPIGQMAAPGAATEVDLKVANLIVPQIPNGACLQLGIGGMPNAIGSLIAQSDLKDLGVHTEMYVDAFVDIAKAGKITGARKQLDKGRQVYAFGAGTQKMYDYLNDNPECMSAPVDYTNDIRSISALDNFISINNAVDIDLFGQVNAETAGIKQISGAGGQLDFVLGAYLSKGGKSFICLSSTFFNKKTGQLESRIRPTLENGSVVTDTRANIHYLCTEYGCVNLKGLTTWEKAEALINVAHPDFREDLIKEAEKMHIWRRSNKV